MQKITPFLWYNGRAEEAINFYTSVFKNSKVVNIARLPKNPSGDGNVIGTFEIEGQRFMALDGGPQFTFSPAISLVVNCQSQAEVDELWTKLSAGGQTSQCGWLTDKFGVSWQIVPTVLGELMSDKDSTKTKRVFEAMLQMTKLDIQKLQDAYAGKA